jgi:predicted transcriptional regulator
MKKHNGMRPQDIVILLKIISLDDSRTVWYAKELATELHISPSEVSESLNRSVEAGLLDHNKRRVNRQNLLEFICHGLRYVYPAHVGTMVKGIPTAHSYDFMKAQIQSETTYVWPDLEGAVRGLAIEPLYPNLVKAVKHEAELYKLLALVDVMRIGRVREIEIARNELKHMFNNGSPP